MKISWLNPEEMVGFELRQLTEEGIDVASLASTWREKTSGDPPAGTSGPDALQMLDVLSMHAGSFPVDSREPSTLSRILPLCGKPPAGLPRGSGADLADRILGGWRGRAAGCLLGKPVEKISREGIREVLSSNGTWPLSFYITEEGIPPEILRKYPWNRHQGRESLRENIDGMTEDDDLNYAMVNLAILESKGRGYTPEDVIGTWLSLLPVFSTFTAERVAYANALAGLVPPGTATHRNPYREWIGAQIRGDLWGWACPGDPRAAARLAFPDACVSHVRNGIYGEMFVAGMIAGACSVTEPRDAIEAGLCCIPQESRLAEAVRTALALPGKAATWEDAVDLLYEKYGRYHWVHSINNAALVVAALVYGEGDFAKTVCNAVMGGWDTDSNGATAGSVVGTLRGAKGLPGGWIGPLKNTIRSSVKGCDRSAIDALARRTVIIAESFTQG